MAEGGEEIHSFVSFNFGILHLVFACQFGEDGKIAVSRSVHTDVYTRFHIGSQLSVKSPC